MTDQGAADLERRFAGIARLYGPAALQHFQRAHVAVVGVGGVGSWAAEALARSAIGRITLIDLDMVAESNVNRQVHALDGEFGKAKVSAMAQRIQAINPACTVSEVEDFVTPENVDALFAGPFDYVIDAIDQVRTKAAMIACARRCALPLITAGGAGGQIDATRIQIADLALSSQDPLLARLRSVLRKDHGFTREPKKKFGVAAVFSSEALRYPEAATAGGQAPTLSGLNCAGYGSSVCVTATFGLLAAGEVLRVLASGAPRAATGQACGQA
ncbi:MAG: Molybdopterin-synthase adenylyltransferase [Candidatus Accumulibacter regalis]|uniref:Molybdopterin-synthase adenylyltransferase n=1 Tax=Accumulibacter regalis TaxID=522306 RepID=A0A011RJ82_ACCRE|nr:tRNA threonylcarbamoyladenosine dehydratase [Accumulibacter sp.]EXI91239.1 MAG: Molybdopterin-synthase adenylyltransferase [Candidatus Accumulibacter regalis]HRE70097.1 tRNA threonylcarbamoyladenosine dehydratase [Accumulibacter sp.]HRE86603.1 tRNA threonylcarbamoyladenosine dehydratase [Accumulibacter sp.]